MIKTYLAYFYKSNVDFKHALLGQFKESFLSGIKEGVRMATAQNGLESLKDLDHIDAETFKSFCDKIDLKFEQSNKELFAVNEEVSL